MLKLGLMQSKLGLGSMQVVLREEERSVKFACKGVCRMA